MDDLVFIGDWIKDRILGSGSFGTVVLWRHKNNEQNLAIKTCKWGDELTPKHRERWTKEVEMLQNCNHPNIVGTKELPQEFIAGLSPVNPSRLPILCMEYCSGGDLRQVLNKPDSCGGLKEPQVRKILSDIGNAMRFLHSNKITHRDLKPENIVLHTTDTRTDSNHLSTQYKIIDLGYAKEIDSNSICASFVGTLQYLAPELFYSKTYSNSVDYWSLGLLAFEIICGIRPFLPYKVPVEWMPLVKKKGHDIICVYETFHSDVEYSNTVFPENHISKPFKVMIEDWLRVALEWDPKLRGRDAPSKVTFDIPSEVKSSGASSNVVIFSLLENILAKKIINVFSLSSLSQIAYKIDDNTSVTNLKSWICKDTNIAGEDQILIAQLTHSIIEDNELVSKYWSENNTTMIYLYNKKKIIGENIAPIVPKSVQRCLEHHKAMYTYKNSVTLYRNAFYFVVAQMDIYDRLINGIFVRAESLKLESKQLLVKHNMVDKDIGKVLAKVEVISKIIELGKKHVEQLRDSDVGTNFLGGFTKIFKDYNDATEKTEKLHYAWSQLSTRLQSAARRSNEGISVELNNFVTKYNYQGIFTNAYKVFISHKKTDFYNVNRETERQCPDIVKVCYDCLKLRNKILQDIHNQQFILKLSDLSVEFSKISEIIINANSTIEKLNNDLEVLSNEMSHCIWSTISIIINDADNLAELPYSVISLEKKDLQIEEATANKLHNNVKDESVKALVTESLMLRQMQSELCEKLRAQKEILNKSISDYSYMNGSS